MKIAIVIVLTAAAMLAAAPDSSLPQYTSDGKLLRPANYREWIFLSSGLGMTYGKGGDSEPQFTNVFVPQAAYQKFLATGKWPDKTLFVVEERSSATKGSINKKGHFQTGLDGIAVEVKDESLPDKWAYFGFGPDDKTASSNPRANCFQCHEDHAAVEHTFVQFYPTLKPVAEKFGVYRKSADDVK